MQVVSSSEFATHQHKYFDLARRGQLLVNDGNFMFRILYEPIVEEQIVLQPDDDLRRAITFDELLVGVKEDLREMFMKGK
jgi:hypothetical protein